MSGARKDDEYMGDEVLREVVGLLYGDGVDIDTLISKMNPAQSDLATTAQKKDRRQRAITATLSAIGGTAGSAGLGYAAHDVYRHYKPITAKHRLAKPKSAKGAMAVIGLEGVGLGGEIMSTKILGNDVRRSRKKAQVGKRDVQVPTKVGVLRRVAEDPRVQEKSKDLGKKGAVKLKKLPEQLQGVKKNDEWDASFEISKANEDKMQVFGWASVINVNGEPVVDLQGDVISEDEMEKAGYEYVMKSRKGGDMHLRNNWEPIQKSEMIESFIVTPEKKQALGLPDTVPTGWWVGFQVHDPQNWADIKAGKRTGFSIHGMGKRDPI